MAMYMHKHVELYAATAYQKACKPGCTVNLFRHFASPVDLQCTLQHCATVIARLHTRHDHTLCSPMSLQLHPVCMAARRAAGHMLQDNVDLPCDLKCA